MDDYKRQLYMCARDRIINKHRAYICTNLTYAVAIEGFYTDMDFHTVEDLFPEFVELFDNYWWSMSAGTVPCGRYDAWWESPWKEPRIRILDYILRD